MRACAVAVLIAVVACANPNLERARHARYDVDAALVFQGALAATQAKYVEVSALPDELLIKTAWHQVHDGGASNVEARSQPQKNGTMVPGTGHAYRRVFVRFDIRITGDRPYTVDVRSYGAEWRPGHARPMELDGGVRPGWIDERADSLRAAIYERLHKWAVTPTTTAAR